MSWLDEARYAKTAKGVVEIRDRLAGLGTRSRQILILVSRRRSVAELAQLIPEHELLEQLQKLETDGFIERVPADAPNSEFGPSTLMNPPTISGPPTRSGPPTVTGNAAADDASARAGWPSTRVRAEAGNGEAVRYDPLQRLRDAMIRHLLNDVGPAGDLLAARIARCQSLQALRELLPAASSLVESVRGQQAARDFMIRATRSH